MTPPSVPGPVPPRSRGALGRGGLVGLVAGVLLVGVGAWLASRSSGAASFGWFAYAPLSGETFAPPRPWTRTLGTVAVGAGLLVLGFVAGWVVARRGGGQAQPSDPPR
ncbi:hypothetical protein [Oerskovia jenensis]|uniref:hypothetical protein n=1 Tax=Oerskovia jenensis TaxID=162169 RepID=UPI0036DB1915